MKALMNSWWKEFSFYSFWEGPPKHLDWDEEDHTKPLINFSLETWTVETRPSTYGYYNDTGRWRGIHFRVYISRRLIGITIPYKRLPDYVPSKREQEERLHNMRRTEQFKEKWNALTKV